MSTTPLGWTSVFVPGSGHARPVLPQHARMLLMSIISTIWSRLVSPYGVAYNLVRSIMVRAGIGQGVPPDRISLVDVLRCLSLGLCQQQLPRFVVNPHRPGRLQPRAVKRRQKQYARLTHPRSQMRKVMETWVL